MAEDWKRAIWKIEKLEQMIEYFDGYGCPYDGTIADLCRSEIERIKIEHRSSCSYCEGIERATPASPRKKYLYCPMCGRDRRDKAVVESLELAQGKHLDLLAEQIYQNRHHGETDEQFRNRILEECSNASETKESDDKGKCLVCWSQEIEEEKQYE